MRTSVEIVQHSSEKNSAPALSSPARNLVETICSENRRVEAILARRRSRAGEIERMGMLRGLGELGRARAQRRLAVLPPRDVLHDELELLHECVVNRATELQTRAIVGLTLDGMPTAGGQIKIAYVDALVEALRHPTGDGERDAVGFSAPVLTRAMRLVWERCRFPPPISEFIAIAREARADFSNALRLTDRLVDLALDAEDLVEATEPALNLPDDHDQLPF